MNVGKAWSVVNSNPETSAPLPEAVWYQETSVDNGRQTNDDNHKNQTTGFFVSLLQKWDVSSDQTEFKSVFYQTFGLREEEEDKNGSQNIFCLQLPRHLAVMDDHESKAAASIVPMPHSPRMQERRVPILVRFSDNQRLIAMQFTPTQARIAVPDRVERNQKSNMQKSCQHWTVELLLQGKEAYTPLSSTPETMPAFRRMPSIQQTETILPGGIVWLDQSYGNARGSDYQEFMLVLATTKSLLCYTVTLNRLKKDKPSLCMTLSHRFTHPNASAAWWAPISLVLLVGSYQDLTQDQLLPAATSTRQSTLVKADDMANNRRYHYQQLYLRPYFFSGNGPFTSHREVLRNPLLLPMRLERPPPVRCEAFVVGQVPAVVSTQHPDLPTPDSGSLSSSPSSSKWSLPRLKRLPSLQCISMVQLYGRAFIVEIGTGSEQDENEKHCLDIIFHELDRDSFVVKVQKIRQSIVLPKRIRSSKEDLLITTLDDVLCVVFRKSHFHVFLDIQDVGSDSCYVVEKMTTENEKQFLQDSSPALFIQPSRLFLTQRGMVFSLALDLARIAPSISKQERCNFDMLLRRRQKQPTSKLSGREIAISHFTAVGALPSIRQRQLWIRNVAASYASRNNQQYEKSSRGPFEWDLLHSLKMLHECALLPHGAEFLSSTIDWSEAMDRAIFPSSSLHQGSHAVMLQSDILKRMLLPKTRIAQIEIAPDSAAYVQRVAELATCYVGALERHNSETCSALDLFVFAILWRLGDAPTLSAVLSSQTHFVAREQLTNKREDRLTSSLRYLNKKWQASLLLSIIDNVEFGSYCVNEVTTILPGLRIKTIQLALALLGNNKDYSSHADLIEHHLAHRQLADAMAVASSLLGLPVRSNSIIQRSSPSLVEAKRRIHGEDFFAVAVEHCLSQSLQNGPKTVAHYCRLLQSLHSFLVRWDPDCLRRRHDLLAPTNTTSGVKEETIRKQRSLLRKRLERRPSWVASVAIENSHTQSKSLSSPYAGSYFAQPTANTASKLSILHPRAFDTILPGAANESIRVQVRQLFGYVL